MSRLSRISSVISMGKLFCSRPTVNDGESMYKLRPLGQRIGTALLATGFGAMVIGGLLVIKYRTVRRLALHPDKKHIFIQSAGHSKNKGRFVKREDCSLEPGRDMFYALHSANLLLMSQ